MVIRIRIKNDQLLISGERKTGAGQKEGKETTGLRTRAREREREDQKDEGREGEKKGVKAK